MSALSKIRVSSGPIDVETDLPLARRITWIGALSFEERCSRSLQLVGPHSSASLGIRLVDYPTTVEPGELASIERKSQLREIESAAGKWKSATIERVQMNAYSYQEMYDFARRQLAGGDSNLLLFDITCLTKIHALGLAAAIAETFIPIAPTVCYTFPENYGSMSRRLSDTWWPDVIFSPLTHQSQDLDEAGSRGIIIPGHERDRLIVAINEIEPTGGLVVFVETRGRPDFRSVSERANEDVVSNLLSNAGNRWSKHVVSSEQFDPLLRLIDAEIETARTCGPNELYKSGKSSSMSPLILYPYGPKPVLFCAGLKLACDYPSGSWFVYPRPANYDVAYSEGASKTIWLVPEVVGQSHGEPAPGQV
jgi:hypothetical protein